MDYTKADADSLTTKLDDLDLTDGEKAALVAVFVAATDHDDDEVSGFAYDLNPNQVSFNSFNIGMPPTRRVLRSTNEMRGIVANGGGNTI